MSGGMKQLLTDKKSVYECVSNGQKSHKTRLEVMSVDGY